MKNPFYPPLSIGDFIYYQNPDGSFVEAYYLNTNRLHHYVTYTPLVSDNVKIIQLSRETELKLVKAEEVCL